jgi:hypothetical protein
MNDIGKFMIFAGIGLSIAGLFVFLTSKLPGGKLPGDILIKKENFTFYFPLATCILLSILLTLIMHFFRK